MEKNNSFFPIAGSKTVTVNLMFDVDENVNLETILRNASEALKWRANAGDHMTWVRVMEVKGA